MSFSAEKEVENYSCCASLQCVVLCKKKEIQSSTACINNSVSAAGVFLIILFAVLSNAGLCL